MSLIAVGRLVGVFGVRGEMKCAPTPAGRNALAAGEQYALDASGGDPVVLCDLRRHGERWLVTLEGVTSPEAARAFVGRELFAPRERLQLPDDEYLDEDLIGLRLRDPDGRELGMIVGVEHFPAGDYLVVGERRALVPAVPAVIKSIDRAAGTITAELPEGLLE
jgi:16S rRNA processing protein RimM